MRFFATFALAAAFTLSTSTTLSAIDFASSLYVQVEWARTNPYVAGAQAHAEYRFGPEWEIDFTKLIYLVNAIAGPLTHSLDKSGYGQVDQYVGVTDELSAPLPAGCYRANADARSNGLNQGASTTEFCIEDPPPSPPGGTDTDGDGQNPGDGCFPCPESPILLDLTGDGIRTTGVENPVRFDLDADGTRELLGWSDPLSEDAFLWVDLDHDHLVTDGRELFGIGTTLPDETKATNGFEALRAFDTVRYGGNADGRISSHDAIWARLSLWVDRNHDGISDPHEVNPIHRFGIVELLLAYAVDPTPDDHGNVHLLKGAYVRRSIDTSQQGITLHELEMTDIFFQVFGP